jgi:hypothetical protein
VRRGAASCRAVLGSCQWRRRSGPQRRCRRRGAVLGGRAPPGAVTPGEVGPPSGGRRREDVRTPAGLVVALSAPRSRRGTSVQPVERTSNVQCPMSGVPVSGVQASAVQVSGRTGLRCPRHCRRAVRVALDLEWLGMGAAGWAQWVEVPPVSVGGWSPASGLTGSDGAAVGRARRPRGRPSPRADAWPASRLRRRLAAGPTRAGPGPGAGRVGEPGTSRCSPVPRQGVWAVAGVVPDHGLDQEW